MTQTVLLAGATGYIGSRLAEELLAHNYQLLCPVRDATAPAAVQLQMLAENTNAGSLTLLPVDFSDPDQLSKATRGRYVDALVSCVASRSGGLRDSLMVEYQLNHHLLNWALANNVGHFTLLSAICVQKPRLAFQHAKLQFEIELQASGISHSIVRPTAFFKSLSGQLGRLQAGKPFLLFGDGQLTRCKPIAEADLARFLRLTLEDKRYAGVQPIGGPGPAISPRGQAEMLSRLLGRQVRTRSVSPSLLAGIASMLSIPGRFVSSVADKAEFARIGHYYATESMLLWDPQTQRYDDTATPEFGTISLEDSYRAQLAGKDRQELGSHAMFD